MHEIISFGCSFTWGYGLNDTDPKNNMQPSNNAWPSVLQSLDDRFLQVDNVALPGNSNKDIWWEIINYEFSKYSYIFVLWTFLDRFSVIQENGDTITYSPKDKKGKEFFKNYHTNFDALVDLNLRMDQIYKYIESLGLPQHHMLIDNSNFIQASWNSIRLQKIDFNSIIKTKQNKVFGHPNEKEHRMFAELIAKEIE